MLIFKIFIGWFVPCMLDLWYFQCFSTSISCWFLWPFWQINKQTTTTATATKTFKYTLIRWPAPHTQCPQFTKQNMLLISISQNSAPRNLFTFSVLDAVVIKLPMVPRENYIHISRGIVLCHLSQQWNCVNQFLQTHLVVITDSLCGLHLSECKILPDSSKHLPPIAGTWWEGRGM